MARIKMLHKRRGFSSKQRMSRKRKSRDAFNLSLKNDIGITTFSPTKKLGDIKLIGTAIMECLINNDPKGVMEAIETHLEAINKSEFIKEAGIPRSTMYKILKTQNPTIKTLAKIVSTAHHS